jgi:hypothetical protein
MKSGKMKTEARGAIRIGAVMAVLLLAQGISMGQVLKATPDHFDFGALDEGSPAAVTVEIENTGSEPVEITNVRTS